MNNYVNQVWVAKRRTMTLGVDCRLSLRDIKKEPDPSPLSIHDGFSRFELTIIDTSEGKGPLAKVINANIRISDFAGIMALSQAALISHASMAQGISQEEENEESESPISSVPDDAFSSLKLTGKTFLFGPNKGKSALRIAKSGVDRNGLSEIYQQLEAGKDKYPINKDLMEDIDKILVLMDTGEKISVSAAESAKTEELIAVYSADIRTKAQTDKEGRHLIYSVDIDADFSKKNPWRVTLSNCYAPVKTSKTGLRQPDLSHSVGNIKKSFHLTNLEYFNMISRMENTAKNFENLYFGEMLKERDRLAWKHES